HAHVAGEVALLVATAWTAGSAWRRRNFALLALCLTPFVHLVLVSLSAQTMGGYYNARRYWFASLLVFPLLLANAIVLAEGARRGAVRWGGAGGRRLPARRLPRHAGADARPPGRARRLPRTHPGPRRERRAGGMDAHLERLGGGGFERRNDRRREQSLQS